MDRFNHFLKYVWLAGGILCLIVFTYQATPILLTTLQPYLLQPFGMFLICFGLGVLTLCAVFLFTMLYEELEDRRHFLRIRRRMRELDLLTREQEVQHIQKHQQYRTYHAGYRQARHKLWRRFKRNKG